MEKPRARMRIDIKLLQSIQTKSHLIKIQIDQHHPLIDQHLKLTANSLPRKTNQLTTKMRINIIILLNPSKLKIMILMPHQECLKEVVKLALALSFNQMYSQAVIARLILALGLPEFQTCHRSNHLANHRGYLISMDLDYLMLTNCHNTLSQLKVNKTLHRHREERLLRNNRMNNEISNKTNI